MQTATESPVGQPLDRTDGVAKVTGRATYAADAPIRNAVFAAPVSSTIAKGAIAGIDSSAAEAAPGVILIITSRNMPKSVNGKGTAGEARPPLSDDLIHYAGQYVAVVVAETPEQARHAATLVKVAYRAEDPVINMEDRRARLRPEPKSQNGQLRIKRGDVDQALTAPGLTILKQTYSTPVETHNPMEMGSTTAIWEAEDRLTVWDATQGVSNMHTSLAGIFGLKPENVRLLCPFVGGGFGCKGAGWTHTVLAVAAAKLTKRPVKLMLSREQMFTGMGHRPTTKQEMTLAADRAGKLVAIRHACTVHGSKIGTFVEPAGATTSPVLYQTPNLDVSHVIPEVDVAPPTFMRAPGETPGTFALESAMDELSYALGIDPIELRVINHADVDPESGMPWSMKHLKECYRIGAEKFGWSRRDPKPGSMRARDGRLVGWGMATALYPARKFPGSARVRLSVDARGMLKAVAAAASQDLGTGTWTIGAQIIGAALGMPMDQVSFEIGDSDLPPSGVSGGSTTAASIAQALNDAADSLKRQLIELADSQVDPPFSGLAPGEVTIRGSRLVSIGNPSHSVDLVSLIRGSGKPYIEGTATPPGRNGQLRPATAKPEGQDYAANARKYAFHSFGAHFVEVTIDDLVPMVQVTRMVSVMDVGKVVNPKTTASQIIGGATMGIGQALFEDTRYDQRTARPMTSNLADYAVCVNSDIHQMEPYWMDIPDLKFNPVGCRGVGEIGITGAAAAVANAVYHATGRRVRDLPITPDKLL